MKKRIISLFLSILIAVLILPPASFSAQAADYASQLRGQGFPESYIPHLVALHNKYPNWSFEPLFTGESWSTAVSKERTSHSQQKIEKNTINDGKGYYCNCSSCFKNGSYVVQENPNWVSASQSAVEYYMDPRNFLNEKYIFQFETNFYNSSHSQEGVEAILAGTWMHNANITYQNAQGQTVTYSPATKYSAAIMAAAKNSGLSAYYLASKIVQEVGGKTNSAGGASGTNANYPGIYNYYNIGAYTGAEDGLRWASSGSGYTTNVNANMRSASTTSSSIVVNVPMGTAVIYNFKTDKQSDDYVWYNVTATVGGTAYTGYIRSDLINYSSQDKYNRPWTNPYLSIYNGALYIKNNFGTQYTGYLQKFNVNPASGSNMHGHEYMTSVYAAANEAVKTYNAYYNEGTLAQGKTFSIPVFTDMPGNLPAVQNLKATNITKSGATLTFDKVTGAAGYELQYVSNGAWKSFGEITANSRVFSSLASATSYTFRVRAYSVVNGQKIYSDNWSSSVTFTTLADAENIPAVQNLKAMNITKSGATLTFDKVTGAAGYELQYVSNGAWKSFGEITANSRVFSSLASGTSYTFRVRAYIVVNGQKVYSNNWSSTITFKTLVDAVNLPAVSQIKYTNITETGATLTFNKVSGADGYQLQYVSNGAWKNFGEITTNSRVFSSLASGTSYTFRVRAYAVVNGQKIYSNNWSGAYSFTTLNPTNLSAPANFKASNVTKAGATLTFDKVSGADGYELQYISNGAWKRFGDITANTRVFSSLASGTSYTFRVRAYAVVNGQKIYSDNWSSPISFTTLK